MVLTSSMENYLKAVFTLRQTHGRVRCIHIAERMDVTLPSVSRAVKELEKMGHVSRDEDGSVTLTPSGERIAAEIYERHRFFTQRLIAAGVDPETAAKEACHMEHGVSENSYPCTGTDRKEYKIRRALFRNSVVFCFCCNDVNCFMT